MRVLKFSIVIFILMFMNQESAFSQLIVEKKDNTHNFKPLSHIEASTKAQNILKTLSLDEKISLIGGYDFFYVHGIEKHHLPNLYLSDATQGVHIRPRVNKELKKSTAFPCPILLSSTWNPILAHNYATAIGEECRAGKIAVLLAPGMNIYRISQNGRNFEYFGEDPYLTSRMIENYVEGLQRTGTPATLKHFITNNTEHHRRISNSVVSERALHEIYLPGFKAGVNAGALGVMTAYNKLNGEWCAENKHLVSDLLRKELGFKWLVMSDWWSIWHPEKAMKSGLSLDMPGDAHKIAPVFKQYGDVYFRSTAKKFLEEGKISLDDIDRMAGDIISYSLALKFDQRPLQDSSLFATFPQHEKLALQTAREGIVLLKNENNILPLNSNKKTILVCGEFIERIPRGKGSASVKGYNQVNMLNALKNEFGNKIIFKEKPSKKDFEKADVVIISVGTIDSESYDMYFDFPEKQNKLILKASEFNKNIIVVVNSGGGRNMSPWNDKVSGIIYSWYPGQNGFTALAEILSGKTNPSGKLPISIEKDFKDSPGYGYISPNEKLPLKGSQDLDMDLPQHDINYKEGIFVGYRWYENKNIAPLYPFGFGLSYTSFKFSNLKVESTQENNQIKVNVTFTLKNTEKYDGAEVAQVYISDVDCSVDRPKKELKAFKKVALKAGEEKQISIDLKEEDFAFWNSTTKSWTVENGDFVINVGNASSQIHLKEKITINK